MPVINFQSLELQEEQKKILAEKFVDAVNEVTQVPKEGIYVFFQEHSLDSAAKGGILFSERPPKFGVGKFNK